MSLSKLPWYSIVLALDGGLTQKVGSDSARKACVPAKNGEMQKQHQGIHVRNDSEPVIDD